MYRVPEIGQEPKWRLQSVMVPDFGFHDGSAWRVSWDAVFGIVSPALYAPSDPGAEPLKGTVAHRADETTDRVQSKRRQII